MHFECAQHDDWQRSQQTCASCYRSLLLCYLGMLLVPLPQYLECTILIFYIKPDMFDFSTVDADYYYLALTSATLVFALYAFYSIALVSIKYSTVPQTWQFLNLSSSQLDSLETSSFSVHPLYS